MVLKNHGRSNRELICTILPAILLCDCAGVLGILIYNRNKDIIIRSGGSLLALSITFLIANLALPFALINKSYTVSGITAVFFISGVSILGAGLCYLNLTLFENNIFALVNSENLFRTFNSISLISLLTVGVSLGYISKWFSLEIESYSKEREPDEDFPHASEKHDISKNMGTNLVSLKASAATLVDRPPKNLDDQDSFVLSTASRIDSRNTKTSESGRSNSQIAPKQRISHRLQGLSIINQSTSSTDIANIPERLSDSNIESLYQATTPILDKIVNAKYSKDLLAERDAIKRIPSALLPPHLRPQEEIAFSGFSRDHEPRTELLPPVNLLADDPVLVHSQTFSDFHRESIPEEEVIQQIPRSSSIEEMFPFSHRSNVAKNGLRTISLNDWEQRKGWLDQQKFRIPSGSLKLIPQFQRDFGKTVKGEDEANRFTFNNFKNEEVEALSVLSRKMESQEEESESSTEQALKYVESIKDFQENDIYQGGVDQSFSTLHLDDLYNDQVSGSKSHSPQKSISLHRAHSHRSSMNSFTFKSFSGSVPNSPNKKRVKSIKTSPKKMRIKNLSLSSISFKYDQDESMSNFTYVHELQNSPSKRKPNSVNPEFSANTPIKELFDDQKSKHSPSTPESDHSNSSFPNEVIGQYDREKWKTLERLNLVQSPTKV